MSTTTEEIKRFYVLTMAQTADGLVETVSKKNGIPRPPKSGQEFTMMPVYEDGVESLLHLASKRAPTTLHWPTSPANFLQAYWQRSKDERGRVTQRIVVLASNYCWARFYAAKELMHCFMDEDGYPASGTLEQVNELLENLSVEGITLHENCLPQTIVDEVAYLGAARYLIPESWLPALARLHADLAAAFPDKNNFLHLAQLLRAPELLVRYRLRRYQSTAQPAGDHRL